MSNHIAIKHGNEKHHTIGFDSIDAINWHLANMYGNSECDVIIDMPAAKHHKHSG